MEVPESDSADGGDGPHLQALPRARPWHCWFCREDFTPHAGYGSAIPDHFVDQAQPEYAWLGRWWHWGCFPPSPVRDRLAAIHERLTGWDSGEGLWECRGCLEPWTGDEQRAGTVHRIPLLTPEADHPLFALGHRYVHLQCLPGWRWREPIQVFLGAIRYPTPQARRTFRLLRDHRSTSRFRCYLGAPRVLYPDGFPPGHVEPPKNQLVA